ncbi:TonB-dependent receptor plug domain-containing protein [Opitutus sp. ER46]|uniref:TonB-dependent receptor plug domain-containing protein n=1 Tax=Opitutus sp. ER46 TaxID=2161864 RepID=UPI000D310E84|nr:TonB-dependent receptor plug domain-containing protein [Opitutus sp. ER46]PTX98975.1 hypothetical protein DB354_02850 [Opitutus sp. ER46]
MTTPCGGRTPRARLLALALVLLGILALPSLSRGAPVEFNIPAQSADRGLLAFAKQAKVEILFSYEDLRRVQCQAVVGRFEPREALERLLRGTGFTARQAAENRWIITGAAPPSGTIQGTIRAPDGSSARRVRVLLPALQRTLETDAHGNFALPDVPPGAHTLAATAPGCRPLQIIDIPVVAGRVTQLEPQVLLPTEDPTQLEPFVVRGRASHLSPLDHSDALYEPRRAGGNLDLPRTESGPLPYMIFNRTQIARSGVVSLNEFIQRELIDSNADALPPEQNGSAESVLVGSSNVSMRGFKEEETVILVNGRRLPEVLISGEINGQRNDIQPPDVSFIPLSLVQRVEVLPVAAAALYSGNAVSGVINIVLRPDVDADATEVTSTYTNTLGGYDAAQASLSLLHAHSLLGGRLRVRLNATFTKASPPTETELGFRQARVRVVPEQDAAVFGATPNVRTIRPVSALPKSLLPPLFPAGNASVSSVAPGADGSGGLAAFQGREGRRNLGFFDSPGSLSTGLQSLDFPYGREQRRSTYFGSVVGDVTPWLQLSLDGTYSHQTVHRGFDVIAADLTLPTASPLNPFGQEVKVSLLETAPQLGENYSEARLESAAFVLGALVSLPRAWRLALDAQYSRALVRYRGLWGADTERWQRLINEGRYNPLRDTQVYGPPPAFYDEVLVYRKGRGKFATMGDYSTIDLAARAINEALPLPTGAGVLNLGADYRQNRLEKYNDERRYADGTEYDTPTRWDARTLTRYSLFGEVQGNVVRPEALPRWLARIEGDVAVRYVAANSSRESNVAPTFAAKIAFPGGLALRGSVTTSTRFPTPHMSRPLIVPGTGGGVAPVNLEEITDPRRNNQTYAVAVNEILTPDLQPESTATQAAGLLYQAGKAHRIRAAIDFVDTRKVNEIAFIDRNTAVAHEALWPDLIQRAAPGPGEAPGTGIIERITTTRANLADRHSQHWLSSVDYRWDACLGGRLEAYARLLAFTRYDVRSLPTEPMVNELSHPDGLVHLLKYRSNFGAAWSNQNWGFGLDGHYFASRLLRQAEWEAQGHDRIRPYWQFDAFVQTELARWLPWNPSRYGLRLQVRVNNLLNDPFPKYANDSVGAGVQPYGDWRGRVYSLSLTASF